MVVRVAGTIRRYTNNTGPVHAEPIPNREVSVRSVRFSALLTLCVAVSSFATVFAPLTDRDLVDRSDAIVVGTVTARSAHLGTGGYVYTDYQLAVEEVLKGTVERGQAVTISEIGGELDGRITFIDASATYQNGEQVLTFLRQRPDGSFYTSGMTRGVFTFGRNIGGEPIVVRDLAGEAPDEPVRLRDGFITFIRQSVRGETSTASYVSATPESTVRASFVPTTFGNAKNYAITTTSGQPFRWLCGSPTASPCTKSFTYTNGTVPSAATNGAAAWTNDPVALITLNVVSGTGTTNEDDCKNVITIGALPSDPRCDAAIACTLGAGGSTGCTAIPGTHSYDGDTWISITDADIIITPGKETSAVFAHEMGHAIGLRHSNQGTPFSSSAVMNSVITTSSLQQWDKDAVDSIYGPGPQAPPCQPVTTATVCCSRVINSGSSTTLTASNDGDAPYNFQWYQGKSFDTSKPVGTNSSSFPTGPITTATDFWVKVTNCLSPAGAPGGTANSQSVTITPQSGNTCNQPAINQQPSSQSIGSGTTTTLNVSVSGTAPFSYQWYEGTFPDTSKPVATTASFTTPALTQQTSYWVRVTNACGQVDSQTAVITIIGTCTAPQFVVQPRGMTMNGPRQVALVATASGDAPMSYRWFRATAPNQQNEVAGLSPSDDRFVRQLYVDLLGAEPSGATAGILIGLLSGGSSKQSVALQVLTSAEYRSALVNDYYRDFLRRDANPGELGFFAPLILTSTDEEVAALILGSDEYYTGIAGGTSNGFVAQVFTDVLGRAPSSAELVTYGNLLTGGFSRSDVALLILRSTEARQSFLQQWFTTLLRRNATSAEVSSFVGALNGGQTAEQIMSSIIGSGEYNGWGSVLITDKLSSTTSYWVLAANTCGSQNSQTATVSVRSDCSTAGPPSVVTQPQNTSTITGVPVSIGVGVSGTGPFTFQWFEGNVGDTSRPVSGATNAQLQVLSNTVGTKTFWVRVANACSRTVNSSSATVTINCGAPTPKLFGDGSVRSGLAHTISWSGDNTLYSSFELQISNDSSFSNPNTQTLPAVQLPAGGLNVKSFTDVVDKDTRFYYRIRGKSACNGQFSEFAGPVTTLIVAPQPSNTATVVLNVGGNQTVGVVTQDLFIPGFSTSGKTGISATGSFTVTSDRDFVTIVPSSGPLPPQGTTVKVNIDASKIGIGSTQATLTIVANDGVGKTALGASRTTSTSVSASKTTPVASTPKDSNASPESLIVLAVGHGIGASGPFQSDVRITNTGTAQRNYLLTFTPAAVDGTKNGRQTTVTINSGETKALNDVVAAWFGAGSAGEPSLGTLEVRPLTTSGGGSSNSVSRATVASSLTYFVKENGATFGQYIPALPLSQFLAKNSNLKISLQQIQQNTASRTNIGLVEGSGQPATAELRLFDKNNNQIAATQVQLKPFEFLQRSLGDTFFGQNVNTDDARLEVKTLTDTGKISAYASVVENKTSDPTLVFPKFASQVNANRYVVPGVANLTGANNSNFHTDMRVFNGGASAVPVTMTFSGNGTAAPFNFTLQPGEVRSFNDVVKNTFGLNGAGGAIVATTQSNSSLVLTARTYSIAPDGGTFGQFIPGVTPAEGIGTADRPFQITQLEQSAAFRSNVGVVEVSGQPATVRLFLVNPNSAAAPTIDVALGPNQFVQLGNIFSQAFGASNSVYNGRVSAQVISGTGRISAYGSLIDNRSNDPAFIPPQ